MDVMGKVAISRASLGVFHLALPCHPEKPWVSVCSGLAQAQASSPLPAACIGEGAFNERGLDGGGSKAPK